jgi:hypothetical protein
MDADKYNREKIISDLTEIKSPHQKIEFLSKLKIDFLESTNEADRLKDQFSQLTKGLGYCIKFDQWCDNKINDQIEILKTNKSQSGTASKGGISETDRYEIIDLGKVYKSYHEFNNDLFEVNFTDYQACFNLSIPEPTPLKFKPRQQTKFVYFLSQIPDVKNMAKIALSRFGLDNYYQQKGKAKPNQVFKNKVGTIFK